MPEVGQTVSHYAIIEKLGAGGMGEVYRARDTRLDRTVALKIVKLTASPGADLRQRFEREARAIALLNHPHICTLFDVGRDGGTDFLVMEYCEGETLAQRLGKGSLPVEQALRYGTEIAEALDKAHRAGIVHRDLKPGNIMITKSGVKLLDFGLAKLRPATAATGELLTKATAAEPLTAAGTILGTLHYMAPEQLEGKEADARADIFALGTVLYEMVTGTRAFDGSSAASVISAVMTCTPKPLASLQPLTPLLLEQTVAACLAKDPEDRWQSAADIARELRWVAEQPAVSASPTGGTVRRWTAGIMIRAAALSILAFLAGGVVYHFLWNGPPAPKEPEYFTLKLPADAPLVQPKDLPIGIDAVSLAISPDGKSFAYVAANNGIRRLYVRQINEAHFRPLNGTEGASRPFFKPDGRWLGFYADGKIKKAAFSGSSVSSVCEVPISITGASWNGDGSIMFSDDLGRLWKVPEGEQPKQILDPKLASDAVGLQRLLPDGKTVLATGRFAGGAKVLSLPSGEMKTILGIGSSPWLTPGGYLVTAGRGVLLAAPFDAKNNKAGDPKTVLEDLRTTSLGAQYALSDTGTLLYASGGATDEARLVRVDRDGNVEDLGVPPGIYQHVSMARDGNRVAVSKQEGGQLQNFVVDLRRPLLLTPLTSEGMVNISPIWSPQGDRIVFHSDRGGVSRLWIQAADGSSQASELVEVGLYSLPFNWSQDGSIVHSGFGSRKNLLLKVTASDGKSPSRVLWDSGSAVFIGQLSPDLKWLVYDAEKSGALQICMRPWRDLSSSETQISTQGNCTDPIWGRDSKEIFYRCGDQFMRVSVPTSMDSWIPKPTLMFKKNLINPPAGQPWDVIDNQHFIMLQPTHPDPPGTELYLVKNWFEEIERLLPAK